MNDNRPSENPTIEFYGHLDKAFAFFNKRLFDNQLPKVMFELTNKKNVTSFLKPNKWGGVDGEIVHSIAINPQIIIYSTPLNVYKCIVHEMSRLKIFLDSDTKKLRNYYSKEWAEFMESIGLVPSATGKPGGKKTGQKMSEYPIPGGLFEEVCVDFLLEGNYIQFVDATIDDSEVLAFRNNLIKQCVTKGESLAEHYNNFSGNKPSNNPKLASPVIYIDVADYTKKDSSRRTVYESIDDGEDIVPIPLLDTGLDDGQEVSVMQSKIGEALGELIIKPIKESVNIEITEEQKKKNKVTYQCESCLVKCWGKPGLKIKCVSCNVIFKSV